MIFKLVEFIRDNTVKFFMLLAVISYFSFAVLSAYDLSTWNVVSEWEATYVKQLTRRNMEAATVLVEWHEKGVTYRAAVEANKLFCEITDTRSSVKVQKRVSGLFKNESLIIANLP